MKYFIIQTQTLRGTNDFEIVKVNDGEVDTFVKSLKENMNILVEGNSLMEAIVKFEKETDH